MNRLEIETDHWIERYLAGRLSETEARRFEAYWIENPDLVRDLERAARLKSGLASLLSRGELSGLMRSSWWSGGMRLLALAASLAVVAVGAALWNGARGFGDAALAAAPVSLASLAGASLPQGSVYPVMRLRGSTWLDAIIALPATPQALALRILPEEGLDPATGRASPGELARYAVVLERESVAGNVSQVGRVEALTADADGFVTVFADSRRLEPGRYRLLLEQAGSSDAAARFLIDVRRGTAAP